MLHGRPTTFGARITLTLFYLVLLFFRGVIPACEVPYAYYDAFDQIMRFDTAGKREGLFTIGRFAEQRGRWRVNNYGWNSDIDYVGGTKRQKPCAENSCRFIDLTNSFAERFRRDGVKFYSDYDAHWNEVGHTAAAEVLYGRLVEIGVVERHSMATQ